MKSRPMHFLASTALALTVIGCASGNGAVNYVPNPNWPAAVNSLGRLIAQDQRNVVRPGGDIYNPGFSAADQAAFDSSGRLSAIVSGFVSSSTFSSGVDAMKALPTATQTQILASFDQPVDQTWSQTGQVGNGTTDAGQAVELEIATALSGQVKAAL